MEKGDKELLQDIRDRTIRLETKMDSVNEIKDEVKHIRTTADAAYNKSDKNEMEIKRINESLTWVWRTFTAAGIGIVIWLIQHEILLR